jgi:tRNA 2-thiouridine synthesizing protein D
MEKYGGMKFTIQVNAVPGKSALHFTAAALQEGHEIVRVFFYHDGVYCARDSLEWSRFASEKGVDLLVCVSAAYRRALIPHDDVVAGDNAGQGLLPGFRLGGLGQWMDACLQADRYMAFDD